MVTSSKPPSISEVIDLVVALTEEALRLDKFSNSGANKNEIHVESTSDNERKFLNFKKSTRANNDNSNASKRREVNSPRRTKAYVATHETRGKGYLGSKPKCDRCKLHHVGRTSVKCEKCGKDGHSKETCWVGTGRRNTNHGGNGNNNQGGNGNGNGNGGGNWQGCYNCGDMGHFKKDFPKENQARGRVFTIGARKARQTRM
ncbi:N66 matrix protein-like [Helianthus annuus]|uniref:N66 matrix protein-like n=1 Tax=Helianthus annuus TaxID=4232 RepID=UPI000B8F1115|nr:N66 matrix protein-like [Helianthus annuus]